MNLNCVETGEIIVKNIVVADSFLSRLKGLMFKKKLEAHNGLIIQPCNQIHTFHMKFSIDVLYLDKSNKIVSIDENIVPNKVLQKRADAIAVVEINAGDVSKFNLKQGYTLKFIE